MVTRILMRPSTSACRVSTRSPGNFMMRLFFPEAFALGIQADRRIAQPLEIAEPALRFRRRGRHDREQTVGEATRQPRHDRRTAGAG